MKMKKKLMTLLLAVLALTACHDSKDEPSRSTLQEMVLVCTDSVVYNLNGDTLFNADTQSEIKALDSEGNDWYALMKREDGMYEILKNGKPALSSSQEIIEFLVCQGRVFTLRRVKQDDDTYQWSYWIDGTPRCQLPENNLYSYRNLFISHDDNASKKIAFIEITGKGSKLIFDDFNSDAMIVERQWLSHEPVMSADFQQGDVIYITGWDMYSWRGESYAPGFLLYQAGVFNHKPYVLGSKATEQGVGGATNSCAVVLIDGKGTILKVDFNASPVKMRQHGKDVYILVTGYQYQCSCVFRNLKPIESDALIRWWHYDIPLLNQVFNDFVVLDGPAK